MSRARARPFAISNRYSAIDAHTTAAATAPIDRVRSNTIAERRIGRSAGRLYENSLLRSGGGLLDFPRSVGARLEAEEPFQPFDHSRRLRFVQGLQDGQAFRDRVDGANAELPGAGRHLLRIATPDQNRPRGRVDCD